MESTKGKEFAQLVSERAWIQIQGCHDSQKERGYLTRQSIPDHWMFKRGQMDIIQKDSKTVGIQESRVLLDRWTEILCLYGMLLGIF